MKATRAQVQARVEEVLAIRLDGAEFWQVREYAREKEREEGSHWYLADGQKPLSDAQLWRYIARSDRMIAESCRASRKKLLRRHLAQRRNLYAKAVSAGDCRAALAALRDEADLLGLYPPAKVAPTTPDGRGAWVPLPRSVLEGASAEELDVLARLAERARQVAGGDGGGRGN